MALKTFCVCDFVFLLLHGLSGLTWAHGPPPPLPLRLCETVVPLEDPIITETTSTLQEWGVLWKQLYVVSRHCNTALISHKTEEKPNKTPTKLRGLKPRWDKNRSVFLGIFRWWAKGGRGLYRICFRLCFLHQAAAKVLKNLKKKTERVSIRQSWLRFGPQRCHLAFEALH